MGSSERRNRLREAVRAGLRCRRRARPQGGVPMARRRTPSTRIPSAAATRAVRWPIAPSPTRSSVLPASSKTSAFSMRRQVRAAWARIASGRRRAKASRSASTCSVIWIAWMPELLESMKSCSIAPGCRSTQSTPAPHAWNQRSRGAATSSDAGHQGGGDFHIAEHGCHLGAVRGDNQPQVGRRLAHLAELRVGQHAGLEADQNCAHLRVFAGALISRPQIRCPGTDARAASGAGSSPGTPP